MRQVLVSLEEAAAVNTQNLALVRVLFDFRPQSPYELRLHKVHIYRATACNATHGIAVAILSVCLSVCPSVRRVYCDKTK